MKNAHLKISLRDDIKPPVRLAPYHLKYELNGEDIGDRVKYLKLEVIPGKAIKAELTLFPTSIEIDLPVRELLIARHLLELIGLRGRISKQDADALAEECGVPARKIVRDLVGAGRFWRWQRDTERVDASEVLPALSAWIEGSLTPCTLSSQS